MTTRPLSIGLLLQSSIVSMMIAGAVVAADQPPPAPSKETRAKMAAVHEKMAQCLRSEKSLDDCREEMWKSCQDLMGQQGCPMMDMGMGMHNRKMGTP